MPVSGRHQASQVPAPECYFRTRGRSAGASLQEARDRPPGFSGLPDCGPPALTVPLAPVCQPHHASSKFSRCFPSLGFIPAFLENSTATRPLGKRGTFSPGYLAEPAVSPPSSGTRCRSPRGLYQDGLLKLCARPHPHPGLAPPGGRLWAQRLLPQRTTMTGSGDAVARLKGGHSRPLSAHTSHGPRPDTVHAPLGNSLVSATQG